jgi:uncharacterized membrane protein YhhN
MAALDWVAVASGRRHLEYLAKPATLVLLIAVALSIDAASASVRAAVVVALVLSLVGDVLLMLPGEHWFVFGLGAFLVAHLAYVVAFWLDGVAPGALAVGVMVVAVAVATVGRRILGAVRRGPERELVGPVAGYIAVISVMVASAIGTRLALVVAGAVLFYVSDALIAWTRFIRDHRRGRLAVMITYHLAQVLLVLSLV